MLKKEVPGNISWALIAIFSLICIYSLSVLYKTTSQNEEALQALKVTLGGKDRIGDKPQIIYKKEIKHMATISTNYGQITVEFYKDKSPSTVANFEKLAKEGFYNGVKFHRVIKDFMIQAGDPLSKDDSQKNRWGTGGPGYQFADELKGDEKYTRGTLAMANAGPNTNGSQFFIMHKDVNLPPAYTVFGKVISGMETVDKIAALATYLPSQIDRPLTDVVIQNITLE